MERRKLGISGCLQRKKNFLANMMFVTKKYWWQKAMLRRRELITIRDLEEKTYMTQPEGFKVAGKENLMCKLEKLLYNLKQSLSQVEIEKLKILFKEFEIKDLGEAKKILGTEITQNRTLKRLSLTQKQYLRKLIKRFGMNEKSKLVSTPLAHYFKLNTYISPKNNAK
ncbi:Retrovirus-related Pol polyprotein from transposon TNT 1-94 [Gossypium australe]|uniref:Retrovirus-related Pol polyprotein from transposon TNT 1-94 n=1 Tax=Gossypium australe TaxID=47621 RepID=A0A5B6W9M1_9ROSI|nr:Retrovirus-related Pol polyprotein from transposon TNT 1-94 [Gossypium australe]